MSCSVVAKVVGDITLPPSSEKAFKIFDFFYQNPKVFCYFCWGKLQRFLKKSQHPTNLDYIEPPLAMLILFYVSMT
jgi:hypothetical protein